MKRAYVFPGQGSQVVGMGQGLSFAFAEAREVFQEVDEALGQHLSKLMFEGPPEELRLTENTQPALMAVSVAVVRVLERQGSMRLPEAAQFVAGHSLGEYSALCAAGGLSVADTAKLLKKRGKAMQEAVPVGKGAMAALLGVEMDIVQQIVELAAQNEVCAIAGDNAPGQVVISGDLAAVDRAIAIAAENGFKRSAKLPVSAPFHCALMQPAADVMEKALGFVPLKTPVVPVVANVTAEAVTEVYKIRELLVKQVTAPVRWRESVLYLKEQGVTEFIECGAGTVLAGLAKRIDKEITTTSLHTPEDIDNFLQ